MFLMAKDVEEFEQQLEEALRAMEVAKHGNTGV